jgi:hypothetical protein
MSRPRGKLASKSLSGDLPLFDSPSAPPAAPPAPAPPSPPRAAPVSSPLAAAAPASNSQLTVHDQSGNGRHLHDLPVPAREVLGYPLRFLEPLTTHTQLAATLVCEVVTSARLKLLGQHVVFTTSKPAYVVAREKRWPAFVGREFALLALAVEHDRLEPRRFAEWLERKAGDASMRIDGAMAMGDLGAEEVERITPKGWAVERVLAELGLRLLAVGTGAELPGPLAVAQEKPAAAEQPLEPNEPSDTRGAA